MDITPRDTTEKKALGVGQRISIAIGVLGTALPALVAAVGGLGFVADHLPLLLTGLGSLAAGGVASFVAVRRMRVDAAAGKAGIMLLVLLPALLSGCVAIRADSSADGAAVWAFGWGADSSAQLANVAVTGPGSETNLQTGVSFDSANGEQQSLQAIQSLVQLGAVLAPLLAGHAPAAAAAAAKAASASPAVASEDSSLDDAPPADVEDPDIAYSSDGYGGAPAADGSGVYGSPTCSRCRSYRSAHPDVQMIDINDSAHRAALWSALRARGYQGSSVPLPVIVTASGYTLSAK